MSGGWERATGPMRTSTGGCKEGGGGNTPISVGCLRAPSLPLPDVMWLCPLSQTPQPIPSPPNSLLGTRSALLLDPPGSPSKFNLELQPAHRLNSPAPGRPLALVGEASGYRGIRAGCSRGTGAGIRDMDMSEHCGGYGNEGDDIPKEEGLGWESQWSPVRQLQANRQMST